jgi:hypothetical protein
MILTLMSGSLALAGCGGGSDSLPFEDTPPVVAPQKPVSPGAEDPAVPAPDEGGPVIPPVVDEPTPPTQPSVPEEPGSPSQPSEPEDPAPPVTEPETPVPPQQPDPDPSDEPTPPEEPTVPEEPGTPEEPEEPLPEDDPPVITPPVERNMSLSWRAPTARENGDPLPLAQLQGYRIYYGPLDNPTAFKVDVNDASQTAYTLKNLAKGTYRVAVSAIDKDGAESELSNTMTKVIN